MLFQHLHFQLKIKVPGLSSRNLILVLISVIIGLSSCNSFYWPTTPAPPTFTEVNQVRIHTSGSREGVCGDISYSITKNFYLGVASGLELHTVKSYPALWYKEIYAGGLWWINESKMISFNLGYGHCNFDYINYHDENENYVGEYSKYHLLLNYSWKKENYLYSAGYRQGLILFHLYETEGVTLPGDMKFQLRAEPYYKVSWLINDYLSLDGTFALSFHTPTKNSTKLNCLNHWPINMRLGFAVKI